MPKKIVLLVSGLFMMVSIFSMNETPKNPTSSSQSDQKSKTPTYTIQAIPPRYNYNNLRFGN